MMHSAQIQTRSLGATSFSAKSSGSASMIFLSSGFHVSLLYLGRRLGFSGTPSEVLPASTMLKGELVSRDHRTYSPEAWDKSTTSMDVMPRY